MALHISVDYKNLDANYRIKAKSLEDAMLDLTLKGSKTKLNSISADDIKIYIDLIGYSAGEYEVPIMIEAPTGVIVEANKSKVNVIITE